jgi:hypothetical protein
MIGALSTHSKFRYGWEVTTLKRYLDFNDGTAVRRATLDIGVYDSAGYAAEIKKQMDAVSTLVFTVSFNRTTRIFTISSTANFTLLFSTGVSSAVSAHVLLGYTSTDKSAALTYTAEGASGYEYSTQFPLQSYKDTTTNRRAIDGVVNKSASGVVEVIKFGNERFMECEFLFITNVQQEVGSIILSNPTGLEDFIQLMDWLTDKGTVEFIKNSSDAATYQSFILESTEADSKGLDYDVIELYDRGLAYYFKSGKLKFRLLE